MILNEYPRPNLRRKEGTLQILNGIWDYKITDRVLIEESDFEKIRDEINNPDGTILVPYSPESEMSGVKRMLKSGETLIYRRTFDIETEGNENSILHFGAVDQRCRVWLNGKYLGFHEDGYLPFSFDVSEIIRAKDNELILAVIDDSDASDLPYGKQKVKRGQIWYTPQSGIWQTVWIESVPENHIQSFNASYSKDSTVLFEIRCFTKDNSKETDTDTQKGTETANQKDNGGKEVKVTIFKPTLNGMGDPDFLFKEREVLKEQRVHFNLNDYNKSGSDEDYGFKTEGKIEISEDEKKLWSPDEPWLYPVKLEFNEDTVFTYIGLRYVSIEVDSNGKKKIFLNGKPLFNSGVLDQGYYDKGLYTEPSYERTVSDLKMLKDMGFNMVRKHIKVEPLRWYYHCDRLGLLVWQDMVSGGNDYKPLITQYLPFIGIHFKDNRYGLFGRKSEASRRYAEIHQKNVIDNLKFFPSIIMWVISNEGWGQFDTLRLADNAKKQDPTRLVDHASGWHDQGGPDFKSPHVYYKKIRLKTDDRALILSEFGGYSFPVPDHRPEVTFGYRVYKDIKSYNDAVIRLYEDEIMPYRDILSGAVYTQLSDVEDEVNGLITYDREFVKWNPEDLRKINRKLINGE